MATPLHSKSTIAEIRARFDREVDRFSNLDSGQQATMDAPLILSLVAQAAATHLKPGGKLLDLGCGAGNFTLRILQEIAPLHCYLADLSLPMLTRARERLSTQNTASIQTFQDDLRDLPFDPDTFDCILAGAVLHHLRDNADWTAVFEKLFTWLQPGGRLYVADMVIFDDPGIQQMMWTRYGVYLESLGGVEYREKVFAYIEKEDSPRSLRFQLDLLRDTGFSDYDVLHRNSVYACYYAAKPNHEEAKNSK